MIAGLGSVTPSPNPSLRTFALEPPTQPFFRAVVVFSDDSKQQSVFFFDPSNAAHEVEKLKTHICRWFQLPVSFQARIFHKGIDSDFKEKYNSNDKGTEWTLPKAISDAKLDNLRRHLIYVVEEPKREIQVTVHAGKTPFSKQTLTSFESQ